MLRCVRISSSRGSRCICNVADPASRTPVRVPMGDSRVPRVRARRPPVSSRAMPGSSPAAKRARLLWTSCQRLRPIHAAAIASPEAPRRPARAPAGPTDARAGLAASGPRRAVPCDSRKTTVRRVRNARRESGDCPKTPLAKACPSAEQSRPK